MGTIFVAASNADPSIRSRAEPGYRCDGTADEVEINAAIAALPSGGGKVVLSEGTFTIAAQIVAVSGLVLEGQGEATVLTPTGSFTHLISIDIVNDVTVRNLKIDGGKTGGHSVDYGVKLDTCNRVRVVDCYFYDMNVVGVGNNASGEVVTDVEVRGCLFNTADNQAIRLGAGCSRITIVGNRMYNCAQAASGNDYAYILLSDAHEFTVADNILFASTVIADSIGVDFGGSYSGTIQGNTFHKVEIGVWSERDTTRNVAIVGNVFHTCGHPDGDNGAITFDDGGDSAPAEVVISGNAFYYSNQRDIDNSTTTANLVITGNLFSNGNQGADNRPSVVIGTGVDSLISGNLFETCYMGVVELTGGDRNLIEGNIFHNTTSTVITKVGAATIVRGNLGYVTENGGAAANVSDGGTIAHGLATTPTYVSVVGSVAQQHVTVTSLDGTNVTVAIKADGGGAGTQQTIYWRAWV